MLEPGADAPQFSLPNHAGHTVGLEDLQGRWVLLFWFPQADTPGCTAQAQGIRDQVEAFDDLGCTVLGASFDDVYALERFRSKYRLGFDLLSDSTRATGIAYGVAGPDGEAEYASRSSFLIDPAGRIARTYQVDDPALHAEDVLDDLEELRE